MRSRRPQAGPPGRSVRIPLNGATAARLHFAAGAENVRLEADPTIDALCNAHFAGAPPILTVWGGTIDVRYPRFLSWPARTGPATLRLNASLPWRVEIRGGAQQVGADLRKTRLAGLTIQGGASNVDLELPHPRGEVHLDFAKGVHKLSILRPHSVAARLSVHGGATRAQLDDEFLGAVGGHLRWQTPGYTEAADRYVVTVGRGASGITLAASPGTNEERT